MSTISNRPTSGPIRCAIYTRKSTEEGLDQEFNSLDAQRESGEAYIKVKGGFLFLSITTTAGFQEGIPTGLL